jgi:hypothetical protein
LTNPVPDPVLVPDPEFHFYLAELADSSSYPLSHINVPPACWCPAVPSAPPLGPSSPSSWPSPRLIYFAPIGFTPLPPSLLFYFIWDSGENFNLSAPQKILFPLRLSFHKKRKRRKHTWSYSLTIFVSVTLIRIT